MHEIKKRKRVSGTTTVTEDLRPVRRNGNKLEIDSVGPLPVSKGFTHILTAFDAFS